MPINTDLLIAAAILQDGFVDKDGTPMAGGTITCYQDNSRTTLKNWYYQSSNFADANGNYTFSPLPNPLTLSAAGTICDINGVDTIPFFYPFSETDENQSQPYYITIVNHDMTNQITRPNFPYNRESTSPNVNVVSLNNQIINNGFWRNRQPNYINQTPFTSLTLSSGGSSSILSSVPYTQVLWTGVSTLYGTIVCPSQHDGFAMPDIQFLKNNLSANDFLTFTPFPLNPQLLIPNTITPEYYINHTCAVAGSAETVKCYQFPISQHLNNLSNFPFTVSIQAQNAGGTGTGQNVISLQLLQFTGSGSTSPAPTLIANTDITLNTDWTTYTLTGVFPTSAGLSLSTTEDDGWYLQVQMPTNVICNINFTKPSLYLTTNAIPQNDLLTYDQIDAIINSSRTGDIRTTLNTFSPFGWVGANDGTIGSAASGATTRANSDTWQLYNLLYVNVSDTYAPVSGGRTAPGNTIAAAYTDFIANKPIALTKTLSRVIGEAGSGAGLPTYALGQTAGASSQSVTLVAANLPPHSHVYQHIFNTGTSGFGLASGTLGTFPNFNTDNGPGTSTPFSVATVSPSVFYNMYFKL